MQHKWHKIRIMLFNLKRYEPIRAYTTSLKSVNEYKLIRLVPPYACEWTLLTAGCGGGWESKHWPIAWPGSLSITWDVVMYYGELPGGIPGNSWWGCATRYSRSWPYHNLVPRALFLALEVGRSTSKAGEKRPGDKVAYFRPKNCHYPLPFLDLACKIHILFQT